MSFQMENSELLVRKIKDSYGKKAILYCKNNFRFECVIREYDGITILIYDLKHKREKCILLSEITEVDFL